MLGNRPKKWLPELRKEDLMILLWLISGAGNKFRKSFFPFKML